MTMFQRIRRAPGPPRPGHVEDMTCPFHLAPPIFPPVNVFALLTGLAAAAPWWLAPIVLARRLRSTPSLDSISDVPPSQGAPRVSVILPARNEASHIADCVRAIRRSTWPDLELVVIDDHSTDGTGDLARSAAEGDPRVVIIPAPDLPDGWFGKQWACEVGAAQSTGSLLLFTDADTRHAPDLITRLVAARVQRGAELMSVAGRQDMLTIWERAVQPTVFLMILMRYGGTDALEHASRASDVVANGQCFVISRTAYDAVGRHRAVRDYVAEDVMMAQAVWRAGGRVSLVLGVRQLRTRMYDGLSALMQGWGKNVYAGGRFAMRGGAAGRALYPFLLMAFPLALLAPFVTLLIASLFALSGATGITTWVAWSVCASLGVLYTFGVANHLNFDPIRRAFLAPLGASILLVICLRAIGRGRNVEWKGRDYRAA